MRRRSLQIASNIQRELQNRLARGLADPRIKGLITVTKVELSDDLKNAKAFITVLPPEHAKITMHGLKSATGKLRKDVMERIHIKEMPSLQLVYDEGLKAQMEVMALLEKDRHERAALDAKNSPGGPETTITEPESTEPESDQQAGEDPEGEQG